MSEGKHKMRTVVGLSGGLDSAVCLAHMLKQNANVLLAVNFDYGSKHNPFERKCARQIVAWYNSMLMHKKMEPILFKQFDLVEMMSKINYGSALMRGGEEIPTGHYNKETMKKTVVPCRNMIFISILAALSENIILDGEKAGMIELVLSTHAGDHHIYPDCRPAFNNSIKTAVAAATEGKVVPEFPFQDLTKVQIVKMGLEMKVPFHMTRTCYTDNEVACGRCGACQERLEAFRLNNAEDPLPYETREPIPL